MSPTHLRTGKPRAASLTMVAKRAGVSIATASRVIGGATVPVSAETVERVKQAAADLDYRPQSAGRALRKGTSRTVGVLVSNLGNPAMAAIAASIERAVRRAGRVMLLCDTHEKPDIQDEYLREMEAQLACAVVLVVAVPSPKLDELRAGGTPLIFVNRRDPSGAASPYVGIDNFAAGRTVAAHCLARGWCDPVVIHASIAFSAGRDRLAGFLAGLAEGGVPPENIARFGGTGLNHLRLGEQGMDAALAQERRPPAVVCLSDLIAYGAYRRARDAGLDVPADIAIVSFDDGPLNNWITPWLSAVRAPHAEFGEAVIRILDRLLEGETAPDAVLPHELVVRGGGPEPAAAARDGDRIASPEGRTAAASGDPSAAAPHRKEEGSGF